MAKLHGFVQALEPITKFDGSDDEVDMPQNKSQFNCMTLSRAQPEDIVTITLHYITLHYITLHYITLHYITLHYITLHYITLHYITLHYITLHYRFRNLNMYVNWHWMMNM